MSPFAALSKVKFVSDVEQGLVASSKINPCSISVEACPDTQFLKYSRNSLEIPSSVRVVGMVMSIGDCARGR